MNAKKITFIEKWNACDFRRVDHVRTVTVYKTWKNGGLLYGYLDRFNVISISIEDILEIS